MSAAYSVDADDPALAPVRTAPEPTRAAYLHRQPQQHTVSVGQAAVAVSIGSWLNQSPPHHGSRDGHRAHARAGAAVAFLAWQSWRAGRACGTTPRGLALDGPVGSNRPDRAALAARVVDRQLHARDGVGLQGTLHDGRAGARDELEPRVGLADVRARRLGALQLELDLVRLGSRAGLARLGEEPSW